uniref:N-acetyltransferase domain-containing protein n=1 Tax=Anopheles dirus TaxID=7168 RepID=A0A182NJ45_9DIPT
MAPSEHYQYVIATESDREPLRQALVSYFYSEEPLTLSHRDGPCVTEDDMENSMSFLAGGTITLARTRSQGELVGFAIGGPSTAVVNVPIRTRKLADIVAFLELLGKRSSGVVAQPAYNIHMLAVHPAHRGHSIGRRLVEQQIALVRNRWPSMQSVTVEATSATPLRLMERLGMRETARLSFAEYRDAGGQVVFYGTGEVVALEMKLLLGERIQA